MPSVEENRLIFFLEKASIEQEVGAAFVFITTFFYFF